MNSDLTRVLVFGKNEGLLDACKSVLANSNYIVSCCRTCVEAINHLTAQHHGAAIVDHGMNLECGGGVIEQFKSIAPGLECVLLRSETFAPDLPAVLEKILKLRGSESKDTSFDSWRPRRVSVAVVCDNTILRIGLINMGARSQSIVISSYYEDLQLFLTKHPTPPSNIVMMCGTCNFKNFSQGLEFFDKAKLSFPEARLVIFNHKLTTARQVELLKHGASGFVDTDLPEDEIESVLERVYKGEMVASTGVIVQALKELSGIYNSGGLHRSPAPSQKEEPEVRLTRREREVVKWIARGMRNKQIATQLSISEKTVKVHINNIFKKLGVETRLQAVSKISELSLLF